MKTSFFHLFQVGGTLSTTVAALAEISPIIPTLIFGSMAITSGLITFILPGREFEEKVLRFTCCFFQRQRTGQCRPLLMTSPSNFHSNFPRFFLQIIISYFWIGKWKIDPEAVLPAILPDIDCIIACNLIWHCQTDTIDTIAQSFDHSSVAIHTRWTFLNPRVEFKCCGK